VVVHAESTSNSSNTMVLGGLYASNNTAGTQLFRCLALFVQWSVHAVSSQQPCLFFACLRMTDRQASKGAVCSSAWTRMRGFPPLLPS
jgi:hypothetical protein